MYKIMTDGGEQDAYYEPLTFHRDSPGVPTFDTPAQARAGAQEISDSENQDCEYAWSPIKWYEDGTCGLQWITGYTVNGERTRFPVYYKIMEVV